LKVGRVIWHTPGTVGTTTTGILFPSIRIRERLNQLGAFVLRVVDAHADRVVLELSQRGFPGASSRGGRSEGARLVCPDSQKSLSGHWLQWPVSPQIYVSWSERHECHRWQPDRCASASKLGAAKMKLSSTVKRAVFILPTSPPVRINGRKHKPYEGKEASGFR
jgi:hypothetical protein